MLEEKEEERNPNYGVDYCHQLEIDYYHHFLSLLSRSVVHHLSPLSLWSLVSVSDRGNKDDRVEERTWQKQISSMLSNSLKTCDKKQIYFDDLMNLGMSTSAYSRLHVRPNHPPGTLCLGLCICYLESCICVFGMVMCCK